MVQMNYMTFITFENANIIQINIDDKNCIKIFNNHVSYFK